MTAPLDTDVAIETPEHIVFHYRLAKLGEHVYGARKDLGQGVIVGLASGVLLTNIGASPAENAASLVGEIPWRSSPPERRSRTRRQPGSGSARPKRTPPTRRDELAVIRDPREGARDSVSVAKGG